MANKRIEYVLPNVSSIRQRGGLAERIDLASQFDCKYVEIPADLIKNGTEEVKTGVDIGMPLKKEHIPLLYSQDPIEKGNCNYILHTEPSVPRTDQYNIISQTVIKWHQPEWVHDFSVMVGNITEYFGIPADFIEIHPGDKRNAIPDIVEGMRKIFETQSRIWGDEPNIVLENRTGQMISRGKEIASLWNYIERSATDIIDKTGVVMDVQQLYTVTKTKFEQNLAMIPPSCLKGFHIHRKHGTPASSDQIPWKSVFSFIKTLNQPFFINPEVHHKNAVRPTIDFCELMMKG
ncbi:hypothetical protein [Methanocalculus sp.]|uniref:hypothetical protein n=1 Tax=Methanocalculus sp. TaxID=2004547 RepID=UPI0026181344|nr:hypothetical protein [Methanocalculus sp.]MDG6250324.1 hypothetical protein [Methanocalculus sp.]